MAHAPAAPEPAPQELLPTIPPIIAQAAVEVSGAKNRPCGARNRFKSLRTTPGWLTPFEFLGRLADLVPPPRKHRHRYHGVFAPNHKLRRAVTALAIGNIGKRREATASGLGSDGQAPEAAATRIRIKNPARTTRHGLLGPSSWPGWGRSFRLSVQRVAATSG